MEKVYTLMQERYQIHIKEMEDMPLGQPKWKELFGVKYKYYSKHDINVEFDLEKKELRLTCLEQGHTDIYEIKYPRFTSRGIYDKSKYYQFFFSVRDESGEAAAIIIRADNIRNYHQLYKSDLYVGIKDEDNFFKIKDIVRYQKAIYRELGLGLGLQDINVDKLELAKSGLNMKEFEYGLTELKLRCQNDYLIERFRELGMGKYEFLDLVRSCESATSLMGNKVRAIGLTKADYMEIRYLIELREKIRDTGTSLIEELKEKDYPMDKINRRIAELGRRLEHLIYTDSLESLLEGKNVLQTIRFCGYDICDIDIKALTKSLLIEVQDKNLTVVEMLEMIFNYRRTLKDALEIQGSKRDMGLGFAIL